MQRDFIDMLPAQVIAYVLDYNKAQSMQDEVIYIEKRAIKCFTRMTSTGQVKSFQIPLVESDIHCA